jgi:hypothetical protein
MGDRGAQTCAELILPPGRACRLPWTNAQLLLTRSDGRTVVRLGRLNHRVWCLGFAEGALRKADALGVIPTPLDQVTAAVGLHPVIDIGKLPEDIAAKKPKALSRVLGAIILPAKTAFVDLSQQVPRARPTARARDRSPNHPLARRRVPSG